jgi:hypothetical protein
MKEPKELTIQQTKFLKSSLMRLVVITGKAKELAGYSDNTSLSEVTKNLKESILQYMQDFLVANGPKALFKLISQLEERQPNANVLKTIDMILNRMGMGEKKEQDVKIDIPEGGIFILPAKEAQTLRKL